MKVFDVARWSDLDIIQTMEDMNYFSGVEIENVDDFVEMVIEHLRRRFDPEIGINWTVIQDAIESVARQLREERSKK